MPSSSLPLWAEARRPPDNRRNAEAPAAALQPRPAPATWRHSALPPLRTAAALLLLALLPSFTAFLIELRRSGGKIPPQYAPQPSADANVSRSGWRGGMYSPEILKLLAPIDRDLAPWEADGIELTAVEQMYCEMQRDTFRVQILGGCVYIVGEMRSYQTRQWHLKIQIQEMLRRWPGSIPDLDLVVYTDDIPPGRPGNPRPCHPWWGPILTLNKLYVSNSAWNGPHPFAAMMPCNTFGGFPESRVGSWPEMRERIGAVAHNVSWADRIPKLLFRGGRTSEERKMLYDNEEVQKSELLDVAEATGDNPHVEGRIELPDHCKYKYLLHLQGNTYATRLKWIMRCGSVVLFPVDPEYFHQEFWYHMLEDGVNIRFLPPINASNNGSHLVNAVQWLEDHPAEAQTIAEGARRLIEEVLTYDNVLLYWRALFTKYASLVRFKVELHPDAVPLDQSVAIGRTYTWPDWWECPLYRSCGRVCPLWPDRPIAPHVYHGPPFPFEGSLFSEMKCLADMTFGM